MDLANATAEELLNTPAEALWRSLGSRPKDVQRTWRQLARRWHPDRSQEPQAGAVFAHLAAARHTWCPPVGGRCLTLATQASTHLSLRYCHAFEHELGQTYLGQGHVLDLYAVPHADLALRATSNVAHLPFPTSAIRAQVTSSLPSQMVSHTLNDGRVAVVFKKDASSLRLADVVQRLGAIDPRHVAWIGSGLWNLACYLQACGWTHQAIHAETVWVDPAGHRVALLGGWAYAGPEGDSWAALPSSSLRLAPLSLRSNRHHAAALDHMLIRALLSRLLAASPLAPSAMILNARLPAGGSAVEQYRAWKQALEASFGPPAFVRWDLSPTTFYQEN